MRSVGRETSHIEPFLGNRSGAGLDWRLQELARTQHGVVSLSQLRGLGLSSRGTRGRAAKGSLHRLHQGVYAVGRPDLSVKGRWKGAVLACGDGALLSHRPAASLHDMLNWSGALIDITVRRRSGLSRKGIRVHRVTSLSAADCDEVDGIPCTSVPRTLLDLAAVAPPRVLERACDRAEQRDLLDMSAIDELLGRLSGQPGTGRLAKVLGVGQSKQGIPRSELERRFLAVCRRARSPEPAVNEWMAIAGEEMQCDFVWHRHRVVVEVDGWGTHRTRRAFEEDRRRDRVLRLAGWQVLRFTWRDVAEAPGEVIVALVALLGGHAAMAEERPI